MMKLPYTSDDHGVMTAVLSENLAPQIAADKWSGAYIDFVKQCLDKNKVTRPSIEELLDHEFL